MSIRESTLTITERSVVLIASPVEEWRVLRKCQRSEASRITWLVTCCQMDSRSSSSPTRKILKFSSWTIEFTAVKLPSALDLKRDWESCREPRKWALDSPTAQQNPRKSQLNELVKQRELWYFLHSYLELPFNKSSTTLLCCYDCFISLSRWSEVV